MLKFNCSFDVTVHSMKLLHVQIARNIDSISINPCFSRL